MLTKARLSAKVTAALELSCFFTVAICLRLSLLIVNKSNSSDVYGKTINVMDSLDVGKNAIDNNDSPGKVLLKFVSSYEQQNIGQ